MYWRSQRVVVNSLTSASSLSTFNIATGLTAFPSRGVPSVHIPRFTSLVFHPTEMLYGIGEPDGSGRFML
jgi:regulatory associated protein of mTOR